MCADFRNFFTSVFSKKFITALSIVSVMRIVTKWVRLELRGFRYNIAMYLSYVHIKFDDEIEGI